MDYVISAVIGAVGILVAIFIALTVFSWDATEKDEIGLHYSGGPIEGIKFEKLVDPGASGQFFGPMDKLVKLPANQRTYIVSKKATEGDVGTSDVISATNKEGVQIDYQTASYFDLNTEPKVLRDFYEEICTKYDDCQGDGWNAMLNDNLRKAQETAIQNVSREFNTDELMQGDGLLALQEEVANTIEDRVNSNLGGPYFTDIRFQINEIGVPKEVATGYNKVKAAQLVTQTREQEVNQAEQQALAAKQLQETLQNNPGYLELRKIEAQEKAVESGNVQFWFVPSDSTITTPTP